MSRRDDLDTFYGLLDELRQRCCGPRFLRDCNGKDRWPKRGVYFFFEDGEYREDGMTPRVVRVGTHAVSKGSKATLWKRLRGHRGNRNGGGNHRGSIFRLRIGETLMRRATFADGIRASWGQGGTAPKHIRAAEIPLELAVSNYVCAMPFLWLELDDEPSPHSKRAYVERNGIALLSNFEKVPIDMSSDSWLGRLSPELTIRQAGLWNTNHVAETYDPTFLGFLGDAICAQG